MQHETTVVVGVPALLAAQLLTRCVARFGVLRPPVTLGDAFDMRRGGVAGDFDKFGLGGFGGAPS